MILFGRNIANSQKKNSLKLKYWDTFYLEAFFIVVCIRLLAIEQWLVGSSS